MECVAGLRQRVPTRTPCDIPPPPPPPPPPHPSLCLSLSLQLYVHPPPALCTHHAPLFPGGGFVVSVVSPLAQNSTVTVTDCVFAGNVAQVQDGGGLLLVFPEDEPANMHETDENCPDVFFHGWIAHAEALLVDTVFEGNSAGGSGGGVFQLGGGATSMWVRTPTRTPFPVAHPPPPPPPRRPLGEVVGTCTEVADGGGSVIHPTSF
jgi:hypothetical protein